MSVTLKTRYTRCLLSLGHPFFFLTTSLHHGLRNDFFFQFQFTCSDFYLDFYFPFSPWSFVSLLFLYFYFLLLFGLLFPFSLWTFILIRFVFNSFLIPFQFYRGNSSWIVSIFFWSTITIYCPVKYLIQYREVSWLIAAILLSSLQLILKLCDRLCHTQNSWIWLVVQCQDCIIILDSRYACCCIGY